MFAPLPLTDQRAVKSFEGDPFAVKCTTSPVRAVAAPAATVKPRRLLFTMVIVVMPFAAPAAALIVALPGAIPVTTPPASTVATAGLSEAQLIATPVRGSPLEIRVVASSCTVPPATSGVVIDLISTVLIVAGLTLNVVKPDLPPTIAPAVTSPGPKSLTVPLSSAAAMSNGPAKNAEGCSFTTLPAASLATTVSFTCWPTSASLTEALTSTVLTAEADGVGLGC